MKVKVSGSISVHVPDLNILVEGSETRPIIVLGKPNRNSTDGVTISKEKLSYHLIVTADESSNIKLSTSEGEEVDSFHISKKKSRDVHLKYNDGCWILAPDLE